MEVITQHTLGFILVGVVIIGTLSALLAAKFGRDAKH